VTTGDLTRVLKGFGFALALQIVIPIVCVGVLVGLYSLRLPGLELLIVGCVLVIAATFARSIVSASRKQSPKNG
jgi:hydrogenase/urease accessory protein HupE